MAIRALMVLTMFTFGIATAAGQTQPPAEPHQPRQTQPQHDEAARASHIYRISVITGMDVRNAAGEDLGHIKDLVVDVKSGKVRYAILSFGGFLGLGDTLYAIPCSALAIKHANDESFFLLNVDVKQFENAPGFKPDAWPNVGDPSWSAGIDKFYAPKNGAEMRDAPQHHAEQNAQQGVEQKLVTVYRASDIVGLPVRNPKGEKLGDINELVIDVNKCEVRYAAVSFGGFLGIGDKLFAVPWNVLQLRIDENERVFLMDADREKLENAPGFDPDNWPNTGDPRWGKEIDTYYEMQRRAAHRPE